MGASGKWLKSLISLKKPTTTDNERQSDSKCKKKWRLWRSSSEGFGSTPSSKGVKRVHVGGPERSDSFEFTAAMATVARAPPRDFMVVKQEWAAIRMQTAFRGLLARRALRALKAVVRLQAIFRGRHVRKQAALTLRCMQALVRVQAQVRARSVRTSSEGQAVQNLLDEYRNQVDPTKMAEQGWCNSMGTVDEVRAKLQTRQEGAIKRERTMAYSFTQQQPRSCASPAGRINKSALPLKHQFPDNSSSPGWSWLERWMANKPWESRLIEEIHTDPSETPFSRKSEDNISGFYSYPSKHDSVEVRKNNVTTKILAKPPVVCHVTRSSSAPTSESHYDESTVSTSSTSVSPIPFSRNMLVVDREESYIEKPSYMNLTQSTKAKQKVSRYPSHDMHRHIMEDQFSTKSMLLPNGDTKSTTGSNPSFNLCRDLYPPLLGRHDDVRNQKQ